MVVLRGRITIFCNRDSADRPTIAVRIEFGRVEIIFGSYIPTSILTQAVCCRPAAHHRHLGSVRSGGSDVQLSFDILKERSADFHGQVVEAAFRSTGRFPVVEITLSNR